MTQGAENDLFDISYYQESTPVHFSNDIVPLTGATTSLNANTLLVDDKAILARDTANTTIADLALHTISLGAAEHAVATTGSPGFMSAADKLKLDSTQSEAQVNIMSPIDALELTSRGNTVLHRHFTGTPLVPGFLSFDDKAKMDSLEVGAEDNNIGLTAAGILTGGGIADSLHGHGFVPAGETFTELDHASKDHTGVNGVPGFPGFDTSQDFVEGPASGSPTAIFIHPFVGFTSPGLQIVEAGLSVLSANWFTGASNVGITNITISGDQVTVSYSGSGGSVIPWVAGFGPV
jgi:hypothetical protein